MVLGGDGAALVTPPDGAVTGLMAALALGEGAWIPPANLALSEPVGLEPALSMTEQQTLAGAGIDLVCQRPRGFTLSGVATLQPLGEVPEVQMRRLLILLRRLALREGNLHLFEPNDHALRARVRLVFERLLDDLYRRGAFGGATPEDGYRLVLPAGPAVELDAERGRLVVELRILPARAVIRIRVRLVLHGPGQVTLEEL
jgi:phage tail sheath protein FI